MEPVLVLVLFAALLGLGYAFSHDAIARRALRKVQRSKIGDLPENQLGRIVGQAQPIGGEVLQAPLTGRPCVLYKVTVEEKYDTLRYSEAIVAIGERVAVLGSGTREPDPDAPPTAAYRGTHPTRLRLTSSVKYPLVISDAAETME